ncbi:LicD family protein [Alteromonas sp. a30]|uniref:LicD family protein n=1 Tax=Alteromonas sp. a30 TaxID=2730917 RepID=UPI00227EC969|nr:LicD family protein [Alteromonas sp. a30]MCY7294519.1 LicD family protein [Alteromonas sp. a30]
MANTLEKPKVIIFGASQSGLSALDKLAQDYSVLAFADNAMEKVGASLKGIPVISPLALSNYDFDKILIASEFFEQIQKQLTSELNISPNKLEVLSTSYIKPLMLGGDGDMLALAEFILFLVCDALKKANVQFHVDAGTLLGIYRDGGLIPWDDDLDIAVPSEQALEAEQALISVLPILAQHTGKAWDVQVHKASRDFGAVPKGAIRGIKLKCVEDGVTLPMLDIFLKYIQGDNMDYALSSRGLSMPSYHLKTLDYVEFKGQSIPIPSDVEGYLQRHYGDWKTPVKDWHLGMLKNATVFE